jgi:hypothetical protein
MDDQVFIDGFAAAHHRRRRDDATIKARFAKPSQPGRCVQCDAPLPPAAATGRPRRTCAESCRRAFDKRIRKIRSRLMLVELWRRELGQGRYPRAEIRRHLKELAAELYVLRHQASRR